MTDLEALQARVKNVEAALTLLVGVLYKLIEQERAAHLTRGQLDEMKGEVDKAMGLLPTP